MDDYKFAEAVAVEAGPYQHPGVLVRAIIEGNDATISGVAKAIDMDRSSLTLAINAGTNAKTGKPYQVTRDLAYKLGALFGDAAADLVILAIRHWEDQEGEAVREEYRRTIRPYSDIAA